MSQETQKTTMEYKGYTAVLEWLDEDGMFGGEVLLASTRDSISFWSYTLPEASKALEESVDCYLKGCEKHGMTPCQPAPPPADCRAYTTAAE